VSLGECLAAFSISGKAWSLNLPVSITDKNFQPRSDLDLAVKRKGMTADWKIQSA